MLSSRQFELSAVVVAVVVVVEDPCVSFSEKIVNVNDNVKAATLTYTVPRS